MIPPRSFRIALVDYELAVDIGFHDFEVGRPQRLLVSVELWLSQDAVAPSDDPAGAWNYDRIRSEVGRIARSRRFNLQETLVQAIYGLFAGLPEVLAITVSARKPDVYSDCASVGVTLSSLPIPA